MAHNDSSSMVVELKDQYSMWTEAFNLMKNPNLSEFKGLLLDLSRIYSSAINIKTITLECVSTVRMDSKETIEVMLHRWIMKGYAQDERKSLLTMSMSEPLGTLLKDLDAINNIIEGCRTLFQASNQILGIFQIEAKLSYVGHD